MDRTFNMIRDIEQTDILETAELLQDFAKAFPDPLIYENFDMPTAARTVHFCMVNGVCLVSVDKDELVQGVIMGAIVQSQFSRCKLLQEQAWWVKPELRDTGIGLRLYREFKKAGDELLESKVIKGVQISSIHGVSNPLLDKLYARDFKKTDTNYLRTGV